MSAPISVQSTKGQSHASTSLVCGIIGLFLFGLVLGPIAIAQAGKAEALGVKATGGKVLGWIDLIFGILGVRFFLVSMSM